MFDFFKKKVVKVCLVIFGIVLVSLLSLGFFYFSKGQVLSRFVAARSRTSGQAFDNIKEYMVWSDTGESITNDEANYANFEPLSKSEARKLGQEIKEGNKNDSMYLKRVGSRLGIFPDYRIANKPMSLTLKTNVPKLDVLLNQKKVATSNSDHFSVTVERLPRTHYTASLEGTSDGKEIKLKKDYDGKNQTIDLSVAFKSFTVTSNLMDGNLYFGDNRIAKLKDGSYSVDNYPVTDGSKAYIKKVFNDGEITSHKQKLISIADNQTIKLDVDGLLNEKEAGQKLITAFNQLILYVSTGQDPQTVGTVFEKGAENDFYKGLKESIKAKFVTDNRKASHFTIPNIVLNKMTQVGKESYQVNFAADYDFNYDKSTDPDKKTYGHIIQNLTGNFIMKKSGNSYLISNDGKKDITVAKETNNVKADPVSIFPENLVGSWKGEVEDGTVTMTFDKDGKVTQKKVYKDSKSKESNHSAKVTKLEDKGNGLYLYQYESGTDTTTFVTGGIGGLKVKYAYGIKIEGNKIIPVIWQTSSDGEFDYHKPLLSKPLTKQ